MIKLYKRDEKGILHYAETWVNQDKKTGVRHTGKVGKKGESIQIDILSSNKNEEEFLKAFEEEYKEKGYAPFPENELYYVVVQFPMKSLRGNKRNHWLSEKVQEYLNEEFGWRGIGHVDGFDRGRLTNTSDKFGLNVFCIAVDEAKAVAAIKRCLREYRLDYTRIKIASRLLLADAEYELQYSAKKKDQTFNI